MSRRSLPHTDGLPACSAAFKVKTIKSEPATAERIQAAADLLLTLCGTSQLLPQLADVVSELQEAARCLRQGVLLLKQLASLHPLSITPTILSCRMMASNPQLMSTSQQSRAAEMACTKLVSIVDTFSGAHE